MAFTTGPSFELEPTMDNLGWIKLYRQITDNPVVMKDMDHLGLWVILLTKATHKGYDAFFKGKRITLKPGQLITGRLALAQMSKINEHKVDRILKLFKNAQQIEQQTSNKNRLITILNWNAFQNFEQQDEQQVSNKRATNEQQVSTNNNDNNAENGENDQKGIKKATKVAPYKDFLDEFNKQNKRKIKVLSEKARKQLVARLKEGYTLQDVLSAALVAHQDEHHRNSGFKWLTPEFITRSDKLERYLAQYQGLQDSGKQVKVQLTADEKLKRLGF